VAQRQLLNVFRAIFPCKVYTGKRQVLAYNLREQLMLPAFTNEMSDDAHPTYHCHACCCTYRCTTVTPQYWNSSVIETQRVLCTSSVNWKQCTCCPELTPSTIKTKMCITYYNRGTVCQIALIARLS
jgi:hypothetical protein